MKTLYIGLVSIEREFESGISAELKSFFSNNINDIHAWINFYEKKFSNTKDFPYDDPPVVKHDVLVNSKERNELFRPYYDYLALPLELRQKPGREAHEELERLRRDTTWE